MFCYQTSSSKNQENAKRNLFDRPIIRSHKIDPMAKDWKPLIWLHAKKKKEKYHMK